MDITKTAQSIMDGSINSKEFYNQRFSEEKNIDMSRIGVERLLNALSSIMVVNINKDSHNKQLTQQTKTILLFKNLEKINPFILSLSDKKFSLSLDIITKKLLEVPEFVSQNKLTSQTRENIATCVNSNMLCDDNKRSILIKTLKDEFLIEHQNKSNTFSESFSKEKITNDQTSVFDDKTIYIVEQINEQKTLKEKQEVLINMTKKYAKSISSLNNSEFSEAVKILKDKIATVKEFCNKDSTLKLNIKETICIQFNDHLLEDPNATNFLDKSRKIKKLFETMKNDEQPAKKVKKSIG